ncbi:MAG: substrate-binding domain-containing protein [Polaromonas sp.]|nr:substrate-binding domain-containing protein [Polaromonas sp.]
MMVLAAYATSSVLEDVGALLERPKPPTAIIAQGTYTLNSTLRAIAARGLRIPKDISLVCIGDTDFARMADLTSGLLLSRIEQPALPSRHEKIELLLIDQGSIGPAPQTTRKRKQGRCTR